MPEWTMRDDQLLGRWLGKNAEKLSERIMDEAPVMGPPLAIPTGLALDRLLGDLSRVRASLVEVTQPEANGPLMVRYSDLEQAWRERDEAVRSSEDWRAAAEAWRADASALAARCAMLDAELQRMKGK